MMLMAGREAEMACFGDCGVGDGDDLVEIDRTLSEADVPGDADLWLMRLRARTRVLVGCHQRAIEAVALALRKHSSLSAEQIDSIVRQAGTNVVDRVDLESVTIEERMAKATAWARGRKP
jgi:hypothetical protein